MSNKKTQYVDLNDRSSLERAICGALLSAIEAHGPITKSNVSSAAKRVIGLLKQRNKDLKNEEETTGIEKYDYETEGYGGT